ncbi:hypothetical protein ACFL4T_05145, partial [candidate division KSB1 bacterium]
MKKSQKNATCYSYQIKKFKRDLKTSLIFFVVFLIILFLLPYNLVNSYSDILKPIKFLKNFELTAFDISGYLNMWYAYSICHSLFLSLYMLFLPFWACISYMVYSITLFIGN